MLNSEDPAIKPNGELVPHFPLCHLFTFSLTYNTHKRDTHFYLKGLNTVSSGISTRKCGLKK